MLQVRNNGAQVSADDTLNLFALHLPSHVEHELTALYAPSPGKKWISDIFLIESLAEGVIRIERCDGADVDAATG